MNLYFTYECRALKSFALFITVKVITKLNLGHRSKFEIGFQKISRCLQTTESWSIQVVKEFMAKFSRRTSHEPNQMQMRKILCSTSLAFDSAHVKYGV